MTFITVSVWGALNYYKDSFSCFQGKFSRKGSVSCLGMLVPHTLVA